MFPECLVSRSTSLDPVSDRPTGDVFLINVLAEVMLLIAHLEIVRSVIGFILIQAFEDAV